MSNDIAAALIAIRGAKSVAKVSMKAEVAKAAFHGPTASMERLQLVDTDLRAVGRIVGDVTWAAEGDTVGVDVELVQTEA